MIERKKNYYDFSGESNSSASHTNITNGNKIKNSLPLVVMASKLDCSTVCQSSLGNIKEDIQSEVLNHGDFQSEGLVLLLFSLIISTIKIIY